jgi:hypothetical protein
LSKRQILNLRRISPAGRQLWRQRVRSFAGPG